MAKKSAATKSVETLRHEEAKRKNIPTAEFEPMLRREEAPRRLKYPRNTDLDPQLVWRGKDEQDWSDLVVPAPPLYIQEKVHPKALIDDLLRQTRERAHEDGEMTADLFADFNGIPKGVDKTEFYQHDQNWSNRMILGDSLQVMASLAEREGLRGKVQCIYFDPPYGIKFNSNFQWSTTSRDVTDGNAAHITREPEQVKAFRDTWRDGVHSYLTYLRDRFTVARDLLCDSGALFVQIGSENVHRIRALLEEVFGEQNFVSMIAFATTSAHSTIYLSNTSDYIIFFAKNREALKFRSLYGPKALGEEKAEKYRSVLLPDGTQRPLTKAEISGVEAIPVGARIFTLGDLVSKGWSESGSMPFEVENVSYECPTNSHWKTHRVGLRRLVAAARLEGTGKRLMFRRFIDDFAAFPLNNQWLDTSSGFSLADPKLYVVQTRPLVIQRCVLMTTDPGDLVLDPTCGAGTTAHVAEQWGRRWITADTSRVALALARARLMGARYPFYLLADSREGQVKEAELTRSAPRSQPTRSDVRHGFVYERVPHITLKSIANNAEIDAIWERWAEKLEPLRTKLNSALKKSWAEWEIPREANANWPAAVSEVHETWWHACMARQKEIDASIAAKAEFEYLYDKPYEDKRKVRVAGPFTVESLSPHRTVGVDENEELIDCVRDQAAQYELNQSFPQMILENLRITGVQQAHKEDRITLTSLVAWPGRLICGEGRYQEGETERRAGIFIGPEFGTVQRADLVEAAREAADSAFDVLIACAFNYEAHTTDFSQLGRIRVLKARMNADLHMAQDLKNTGKGNLFVIFGEPDIEVLSEKQDKLRVKVKGVDVFKPQTGEVVSNGPDEIACWFIDTDYNEESFFVRHAYFLGANDPYNALKTTLKSEIDADAWESLHSDTSRAFGRPKSGRIAVKVINHLGDEVMKVFKV